MKKLLIILMVISGIVCTSCNPNQKNEEESYTIMFYGLGGGNLDECLLGNIFDIISEGGAPNINLTFEMKLSQHLQGTEVEHLKDFDGVRRWSMGEKENVAIMDDIKHNIELTTFPSCLKTEKIGDVQYNMGTQEALADFVSWSAKKHPADHYILILSDHGNGWNITIDGAVAAGDKQPMDKAPKAMLFDDNIDEQCLVTNDCVAGIQKSGVHIDMVYMDACLMGLAENIYPFIGVVDYVMCSLESVPGLGGAYSQFVQLIKAEPKNLYSAMSKYCDFCVSSTWWEALQQSFEGPTLSADIAIYDMNKIQPAFDAIKKFADLMSKCLQDTTKLIREYEDGTKTSTTYADIINYVTSRAEIAVTSNSNYVEIFYTVSTNILPQQFGMDYMTCSVYDFLAALSNQEFIDILLSDTEALEKQIDAILRYSNYGVCIADYMKQMSEETAKYGDKRFTEIHEKYLTAIKNSSYVRGTLAGENMEAPYEDASMAANVYSLSEKGCHYFGDGVEFIFQGNRYAKDYSREELIRYYQASEFDKFAGWSRILMNIDINPSFLTNKTRYENYAK